MCHPHTTPTQFISGIDFSQTRVISDDAVRAEQDALYDLCRTKSLPEPRIQIISALSNSPPESRHFIATVQVATTKISSYPNLFTSENSAKLDVLSRAREAICKIGEPLLFPLETRTRRRSLPNEFEKFLFPNNDFYPSNSKFTSFCAWDVEFSGIFFRRSNRESL